MSLSVVPKVRGSARTLRDRGLDLGARPFIERAILGVAALDLFNASRGRGLDQLIEDHPEALGCRVPAPELGMTFAEAGVGSKSELSHRARAMRAIKPRLLAYLASV